MDGNTNIPIVDLSREFIENEPDFIEIFKRVGRSGVYVGGSELAAFENEFSKHCLTKYAAGCGNATDGLEMCLRAVGVGHGDEVITAANSFISSAGSIASVGAVPVLADIREDLNIDPKSIEENITKKTKAIMPVHLTGRPADMEAIDKLGKKYDLRIVEDAAQAIGAKYKGKPVGSFGDAASFSLHPLKNLHVYGDGGVITTSSDGINQFIRKLKNHGLRDRDMSEFWGRNSRLDELQAAIAFHKLKTINKLNEKFRIIARTYSEELRGIVEVPIDKEHEYAVYHNYVIRTEQRDELMRFLIARGVDVKVRYPIPLHQHISSPKRCMGAPVAEKMARKMLSLPIFPTITEGETDFIIKRIKEFFR